MPIVMYIVAYATLAQHLLQQSAMGLGASGMHFHIDTAHSRTCMPCSAKWRVPPSGQVACVVSTSRCIACDTMARQLKGIFQLTRWFLCHVRARCRPYHRAQEPALAPLHAVKQPAAWPAACVRLLGRSSQQSRRRHRVPCWHVHPGRRNLLNMQPWLDVRGGSKQLHWWVHHSTP
jgi:hypothetical protein